MYEYAKQKQKKAKKAVSNEGTTLSRQGFTPQTRKLMPVQPGQHRRHIVSMEVIVQAFKDVKLVDAFDKEKFINWINDRLGIEYTSVITAGNAMIKALENNTKNLIADTGRENSAIGCLGKQIIDYISRGKLEEYVDRLLPGTTVFFMVFFHNNICKTTPGSSVDDIINFLKATYGDEIKANYYYEIFIRLKEIYNNTQLDLMTLESDPNLMERGIHLYTKFINVVNVDDLIDACDDFLS